MTTKHMLIADLNHRQLGKIVRVASADGRHAIAGELDEVRHEAGSPSRIWVKVTAENNVEVVLAAGVEVEVLD